MLTEREWTWLWEYTRTGSNASQDGQDAGEMLLDIEARIGELAEKEERAVAQS